MDYLNHDLWKQMFDGWVITGGCLRTKEIIYLCARKIVPENEMVSMRDSDIPTRLIALTINKLNEIYAGRQVNDVNNPSLGVSRKPKEHGLLLSATPSTSVLIVGSGPKFVEYVDKGSFAVSKLKCVLDYCYAIGVHRNIYKRVDIDQWTKLDKGIEKNRSLAFTDIDAFTEQDMYAVGGKGDVWQYNGDSWLQCGFPSNEKLNAVVCAPDGNVYIGGKAGNIWKGREHQWEKIYSGSSTILWNEMRWFQDKLWVISDYELRVLDEDELVYPKDGEGDQFLLKGHMDVYEGLMVIATLDHVYTFDGKTIHTIVAPYD